MKWLFVLLMFLVSCSAQEAPEVVVETTAPNGQAVTKCTPACEEGYGCFTVGCLKFCESDSDCSSNEKCQDGSYGFGDTVLWAFVCVEAEQ